MKLTCYSWEDGSIIPGKHALCVPAEDENPVTFSKNLSPHIKWEGAPEGTKSYAIVMHDPKVPSKPDDVNQEGRTVPKDLPRVDFYHWVLVDIPASITELKEGDDSNGVTPKGKPVGDTPHGVRGINNYTDWFKGDPNMEGHYGGYDGPCPPWNDELVHTYVLRVYALDVESLDMKGIFGGPDALEAMESHVLDQAEVTGKYSLYEHATE